VKQSQVQSSVVLSLLIAGLLAATMLAGQRGTTAVSQTAANPVRIGIDGSRLTDGEVAELIKVLPDGVAPWLIEGNGPGAFPSSMQTFRVYMPPVSETPELRHGVSLEVRRPIGSPSAWSLWKNSDGQPTRVHYAQVAIDGRPFSQVVHENDANRPFILTGGDDDVELVSLVRYVRALYTPLPISGVIMRLPEELRDTNFLKTGEVQVTIRETTTSGKFFVLRRLGQIWEVIGQGVISS